MKKILSISLLITILLSIRFHVIGIDASTTKGSPRAKIYITQAAANTTRMNKGEYRMKLHKSRISIPEKDRIEIIDLLNTSLASTIDLYAQLKQAHWNVKGMEFIGLHKMFDEIAEEVEEQIDTIAERITSLGGTALGTLQEAAKNTQLRSYPVDIFVAKDHLEHLAHNFATLGELTRNNIDATDELNDMVTNDLYIDLARMLDKNLWFIEAHLQK